MKPSSYETLIDQLIAEQVDMDELCSLVSAEKNKRKKEAEDAKAKERKQQLINATREDLIDAFICYVEEVVGENDPDVIEMLESDAVRKGLKDGFQKLEAEVNRRKGVLFDPRGFDDMLGRNKIDEDAIRRWLNNRKK